MQIIIRTPNGKAIINRNLLDRSTFLKEIFEEQTDHEITLDIGHIEIIEEYFKIESVSNETKKFSQEELDFIKKHSKNLQELIEISNYLGMMPLLNLCLYYLSTQMNQMSIKEIKKLI